MPTPVAVLLMVRELGLGGIERDVSKLARRLPRSRFSPHVACFVPGGDRWEEIAAAGIPLLSLALPTLRSCAAFSAARAFCRYVRKNTIRIVHAFDAPTDLFAVPLARALRVPVTVSSQLWLPSLVPRRVQSAVSLAHRLAGGVYVNCEAVKQRLVEEEGLNAGRIHVCHNGVETDVFYPPAGGRGAAAEGAPLVIGTVAVLRPEKGHATLLEAFARVWERHRRVRLLIVGSGPMLPDLEALRRQLGIPDEACRFHPATSGVAELMRTMDIFVLPSFSEAFSNALLEAMACGCCPIGSRVGGTPELIAGGERGLLFEPGDAGELAAKLLSLIGDGDARRRFSKAAAAFARNELSIEAAAARLSGIYTSLLDRAGQSSAQTAPM